MKTGFGSILIAACLGLCCGAARGAADAGSLAPDFPPGTFTDGGHYHLSDFTGKVVVLYFGCNQCPRNRASVADRNKIVEQFKGKPVVFLAITEVPMTDAKEYGSETKLEMPVYPDGLGVMEHRYNTRISLKNIWQFRVIGPEGTVIGDDLSADAIEKAIATVKWKYKDDGYDPKLSGIVELLEWNQYQPAVRNLRAYLKQKNKTGDSARQLYEKVKAEGEQWLADADMAVTDEKDVKAFDLYSKVAACFPSEDIGKKAMDALKKLRTSKTVKNELLARGMFDRLNAVMTGATPAQKAQVVGYCLSIQKSYPETPTGIAAGSLAEELQASNVGE